jgi:hypothetical protein
LLSPWHRKRRLEGRAWEKSACAGTREDAREELKRKALAHAEEEKRKEFKKHREFENLMLGSYAGLLEDIGNLKEFKKPIVRATHVYVFKATRREEAINPFPAT